MQGAVLVLLSGSGDKEIFAHDIVEGEVLFAQPDNPLVQARGPLRLLRGTGVDQLVGQKETVFDLPWPDQRLLSGGVLGGKARHTVSTFQAVIDGGAESVSFYVP